MRANLYVTITGSLPDGKVVNETFGGVGGVAMVLETDKGKVTAVQTALLGALSDAGLKAIYSYGVNGFGRWRMIKAALRALVQPLKPDESRDLAKEA